MGTVTGAIQYFLTGVNEWQLPLAGLAAVITIMLGLCGVMHRTGIFVTTILIVLLFSVASIVSGVPHG